MRLIKDSASPAPQQLWLEDRPEFRDEPEYGAALENMVADAVREDRRFAKEMSFGFDD